jgi:hypothetical protein
VDARPQGAVLVQRESVAHLGQADEHDGEQHPCVSLMIDQDVQMLEHVLLEQVRFVEQEDGVHALGAELVHVLVDGVKDRGSG